MARLKKSVVVLRFRFGEGLVKGRQRYENTARAIARRVAFTYAEEMYDDMRKTVEQRVEYDVRAELVHLARLFRKHIVGAAGTRTSPTGQLDTVAKSDDAPFQSIASGLPTWAPRSTEYLRQKRAATGGIKWFDNRGWRANSLDARYAKRVPTKGSAPANTGLMFNSMRADAWETIFGPISVRFYKSRKLQAADAQATINTGAKHTKIQVGSVQVRAMSRITPNMLPGYNTGRVKASTAPNNLLLDVIGGYDPDLAYRMGVMRNGVYRPTIEPFLGFFLTRAIPHAVQSRLVKGTMGTLNKR